MSSFFPHIPQMVPSALEWSEHGIAALIAYHSIYFYHVSPNKLTFLKTLDFKQNSIIAIKFHPNEPYLAISQSNGTICLYDCVTSKIIGVTQQISDAKIIYDIQWAGSLVIALSSNNFLYAVDFWPIEADSGAKNARFIWKLPLSELYTHLAISSTNFFNETIYFLSSQTGSICLLRSLSPRLLPKVFFSQDLNPSLSPNSVPTSREKKRAKSSSKINSIQNFNPSNTIEQSTQIPKLVDQIIDIFFHPHIKNLAIIVSSHEILGLEIESLSVTPILRDESTSSFCKAFISYSDPNITTVITGDRSILRFSGNERISVVSNLRDPLTVHGKPPPVTAATSRLFPEHLLLFSPSFGLNLFKYQPQKSVFQLACFSLYTSILISAFDSNNNLLACGTKNGYLFIYNTCPKSQKQLHSTPSMKIIASHTNNNDNNNDNNDNNDNDNNTNNEKNNNEKNNNEKNNISNNSNDINDKNYKNLDNYKTDRNSIDYIDLKEFDIFNSDENQSDNYLEMRFVIEEDIEVKKVKLVSKYVYFLTQKKFGRINLETRTFDYFESRLGLPTNLEASNEVAIVQRGSFVLGIIFHFKSNSNDNPHLHRAEKPLIIQEGIVSVTIQRHQAESTIFIGESPNFAVLQKNGLIQTYAIESLGNIIKINSFRLKTPNRISITWDANSLYSVDTSGQIECFDFETAQSSYSRIGNEKGIKKLLLHNTILFAHLNDGRIAAQLPDGWAISPKSFTDFALSSKQSGIMTVLDQYGCLRTINHIDWTPIGSPASISLPSQSRLLSFYQKSLPSFLSHYSLPDDDISDKLLRIVAYYGLPYLYYLLALVLKEEAPLYLSGYGRRNGTEKLLKIRSRFVKSDPLLSLHMKIQLHEIEAAKEVLMDIPQTEKYGVVCRLAGALLTAVPSEEACELMRAMAIDFYASGAYYDGTMLLQAANLDFSAASYLEDANHWADALDVALLIGNNVERMKNCQSDFTPDSVQYQRLQSHISLNSDEKRRELLGKCAQKLLDEGNSNDAILLFAGIHDWYSTLSVLWNLKKKIEAKILLMILKWKKEKIVQYNDSFKNPEQEIPLESLLSQISQDDDDDS